MVVNVSIADAGNRFRIELSGLDCQSGASVRVGQDAASRKEVVRVLGLSAAQLRGKLGEPPVSVAKFDKPLEEATSRSLEALQLLTEGYRRQLAMDVRGATSYYQRAIQTDSEFALAYGALAVAHADLREFAVAAAATKKAYELRHHLTEPARLNTENIFYYVATGEENKAWAVASEWVRTFPENLSAHNNFGTCLARLGQLDRSLAEAPEVAPLLPSPWSYNLWMFRSILGDRLDEATTAFNEAEKRKFDTAPLHAYRFLLAFLKNDTPAMQEQWNWALDKPDAKPLLLFARSNAEAYYGHFRDARALAQQAIALNPFRIVGAYAAL